MSDGLIKKQELSQELKEEIDKIGILSNNVESLNVNVGNKMDKSGGEFTGSIITPFGIDMNWSALVESMIKGYNEDFSIIDNQSILELNNEINNYYIKLGQNLEITLGTIEDSIQTYTLFLEQPSTAYTITMPAEIKWINDVDLSTPNRVYIINIIKIQKDTLSRTIGMLIGGGVDVS